ncbi:hypothetical protein [Acinetobacter sp. UBA6720]|uniref:hypothetical protein n=1 Tax=Acinetobacter sp. UBA6720 TaxID=1945953 RepID=UPI0025BEB931|nr:hypothetical protein [Acinetobacter sp. UBA6720]
MNTLIKTVLHSSAISVCLFTTSLSHANVKSMTQIYNHPQSAPKVQRCKGNQNCNAFYALSKQWQSIPDNFKISGIKLKPYAKSGDGYGLWKGFTLKSNRSIDLSEAGDAVFYSGGSNSAADERIFAQGLAVLLYLENKK